MQNSDNYIKKKKSIRRNPRIIISRTDNIGDVVLALPMAGIIKKIIPGASIIFLGKKYTKDVVELSEYVDEFQDWEQISKQPLQDKIRSFKAMNADCIVHTYPQHQIAQLAYQAGIRKRIGTAGRIYHIRYCNRLVFFTRRKSKLHESQLNLKLLKFFGINRTFSLSEISNYYGIKHPNTLSEEYRELIDNTKFNLIIHPKTKGSAREWNIRNYAELIRMLPAERFKIFITGTVHDNDLIKKELLPDVQTNVVNLSGKFSLLEFISFISNTDGMVACSTGPLHLAAALGKYAIGIYPPIKPMHPGRWAPLGTNASYLVINKKCNKCRLLHDCDCIEKITPEMVKNKLMDVFKAETPAVDIN
jgi:ADP-heptose:LPS heptosyltransferase